MQTRMKENRPNDERPLGDLFSDLATQTGSLIKQEVTLAKTELSQKATRIGKNLGFLIVGGAIAYAALLALLAGLIILLTRVMSAWLAALIVGLSVGGVAWLLVSKALSALRTSELTPRETVETLKEDAQWIKQQVK